MQNRRPLRPLALAALAVLPLSGLSCAEKAEKRSALAPEAASAGAASSGEVPPEQRMPKLLAQLEDVDLPPTEAPSSWTAGWRLMPGTSWKLSYRQRITAEMDGQALGQAQEGVEIRGTLIVSGSGEGVGDVELTNARSILSVEMPGHAPQKVEQEIPPMKYVGLLQAGKVEEAPDDPLVYAILSVPSRPSAIGEKVSQRLAMPIDSPEGPLTVEGTAAWTLKGFVKCGEHTCASYEHDVELGKLTLPEGAKGAYGARAKALGWTLVDIDDGALYRHQSATHLWLKADVPAEAAKAASPHGAAGGAGEPKRMDMTQEHFHEIVRE